MAKRLCCGFLGKIYYANVNEEKRIMTGQKVDVTESAVKSCYGKVALYGQK